MQLQLLRAVAANSERTEGLAIVSKPCGTDDVDAAHCIKKSVNNLTRSSRKNHARASSRALLMPELLVEAILSQVPSQGLDASQGRDSLRVRAARAG